MFSMPARAVEQWAITDTLDELKEPLLYQMGVYEPAPLDGPFVNRSGGT